ncbi:MAG: hypothetical protein ACRC0L_03290, partial [Angustibacter sp.]
MNSGVGDRRGVPPERRGRPALRSSRGDSPGRGGQADRGSSSTPPGRGSFGRNIRPGAGEQRHLGPRRSGPPEPKVPDDIEVRELDRSVLAQLRSLTKDNAEGVAKHLIMVARLIDEDPESAYAHAMAAQRRAGRVAVVREAVGVAAYRTGRWSEALAELRTARRMSGSSHQLPLMADAERGLGRPERALDLVSSPEAKDLTTTERVELAIVASGARLDLGQAPAAVVALQIPELKSSAVVDHTPRLRYAYAAALEAADRVDEAARWYSLAAAADLTGQTDADEQLARLMGIAFSSEEEPAEATAGGGASSAVEEAP